MNKYRFRVANFTDHSIMVDVHNEPAAGNRWGTQVCVPVNDGTWVHYYVLKDDWVNTFYSKISADMHPWKHRRLYFSSRRLNNCKAPYT